MTERAAGEQTGVQQAYREAVARIGPGPAPHDTNVPGPGAPSAGSGAPSPGMPSRSGSWPSWSRSRHFPPKHQLTEKMLHD
jgi:hypothetical protein